MKTIKMLINKYEEIIAYLIVGAMTTGLSIVSYYFCTRFIALNYQISNVLSWIISVSFAFVANKKFVFKYVSKDRKSLFLEIFNFFKYRILSLLIDMFLMFLLFDQLIVQIIIIIINYIFSKFLVFKKEKRDTFTYQNNNIEITESNISGIINPQLVLKGDVKRKNVILKICTLKKEIFRTKIKEKFFNISVLLSKNDKTIRLIEESENNEILIDTLKNTLLRRVLYKVYAQIKIFKENFNYKRKMLFNRLFRKDSYNLLSNEYDRIFHGGVADRKDYYYLFLPDDYLEWFSKEMEQQKYDKLDYNPLISILIPVYNTDEVLLKECLNSILIQKYQNFEVCIVDDCSTNLNVKKILKEYSRKDKRIKVKYRDTNGHISIATNDALDMATGDYIALMDSDDTICENTLYEVAFAINKNRNIDMIYTDEDKINSEGLLQDPYFKPDYSPENLMFGNYICHFSVFRGSILKSLGGFKPEFVGAQDFDIVLRFVEKINPDNIYHINKVLYHWRKAPGSTAENIANKSYAIENGKKVLESALQRRGLCGKVKLPKVMAHYLIEYTYKNEPMLSIIVSCSQITSNLTKCLSLS